MKDHADHDHDRSLIVLHQRYARPDGSLVLGNEELDDAAVICRGCAARAGLIFDSDGIAVWWDVERYPWDREASRGDVFFRPGPDWPPSWAEVKRRRARA